MGEESGRSEPSQSHRGGCITGLFFAVVCWLPYLVACLFGFWGFVNPFCCWSEMHTYQWVCTLLGLAMSPINVLGWAIYSVSSSSAPGSGEP